MKRKLGNALKHWPAGISLDLCLGWTVTIAILSFGCTGPPRAPDYRPIGLPAVEGGPSGRGGGMSTAVREGSDMPGDARAQDQAATQSARADSGLYPLDLPTALKLAGANNLQVAFFKQRLRAAQARESRAEIWFLPDLATDLGYAKHNGRIQDTGGEILEVSRASQFDALTLEAVVDPVEGIYHRLAAKQLRKASESKLQSTLQHTLEEAAVQYYELVQATQLKRIAQEAVKRSEELVRYAQVKFEAGAGLQADVARAKAQRAQDQQGLAQADEHIATASARLAPILNLESTIQLVPVDRPIEKIDLADVSQPLEVLIKEAIRNRPDLTAAQADSQAAGHREKAARYGPWLPELAASSSVGLFGGGTGGNLSDFSDRRDQAVVLRWHLKDFGFGDYYEYQEAVAQRRQAEVQEHQVRLQIGEEVAAVKNALRALDQQIIASAQEEEAAAESLELNRVRYQGGAGILLQVLEAQQALTAARANRLNSIIHYNQAQHRLVRILGRVPSDRPPGTLPTSPPGSASASREIPARRGDLAKQELPTR